MARKAAGLSYQSNQLLTYLPSLNRLSHKRVESTHRVATHDKRNSFAGQIGLVTRL
jgi:hypothetical protein